MSYKTFSSLNSLDVAFSAGFTSPCTIAFWINVTGTGWGQTGEDILAHLNDNIFSTGDSDHSFRVVYGDGLADEISGNVQSAGGSRISQHNFAADIWDDLWVPVAFVIRSTTNRQIYIKDSSGTSGAETSSSSIIEAFRYLRMGSLTHDGGSAAAHAKIAEVAIFSTALSDAALDLMWSSPETGPPINTIDAANCTAYWPLDTSQATHTDQSGNGGPDMVERGSVVFDADHPTMTFSSLGATKVRTVITQFTADTSTFDVTVAGESRGPTGCVVLASKATALDISANSAELSFGVTDFSTVAQIGVSNEHGQATTDTSRSHQETNIIEVLTPGSTTIDRSAIVAAIVGGVRFTPLQSGVQYRIQVVLIFGSVCKAFSSVGDGQLDANEEFTVAHGMATEPGAGFYGTSTENISSFHASFVLGLGVHAYDGAIEQSCVSWSTGNGVTSTTDMQARMRFANRCCAAINTSGSETSGLELTAIDTTNVTYTQRTATMVDKWIGLLIECDDVATKVVDVPPPTSAVIDWNYNGLSFQSQFVTMLTCGCQNVNNNETGSGAGIGSFAAMDEDGGIHSTAWAGQDGIALGTTNTSSELAQKLFLPTHAGGDRHSMDTHAFTTDGWDFLAANITAAASGLIHWPALAIEVAPAGVEQGPIIVPTGPLR